VDAMVRAAECSRRLVPPPPRSGPVSCCRPVYQCKHIGRWIEVWDFIIEERLAPYAHPGTWTAWILLGA
jgi:hypothetical protein